jgi:mono/diheme cytochrome c family protein
MAEMSGENEVSTNYHRLIFVTMVAVLVTLNIALVFQLSEPSRVERDAATLHEEQVRRGSALFVGNCATCHGADGMGTETGPTLNDKAFLSEVSDNFLRNTIANGRPRTAMPAWGQDEGGPLTHQEIDRLVAFVRNWERPVEQVGRTLTASGLPADSVEGGEETFIWFCADCHGDDGKIPTGTQDIIANSPERLREKNEEDARLQILQGGDEMPGLASLLSPTEVEGLIQFINTWPR